MKYLFALFATLVLVGSIELLTQKIAQNGQDNEGSLPGQIASRKEMIEFPQNDDQDEGNNYLKRQQNDESTKTAEGSFPKAKDQYVNNLDAADSKAVHPNLRQTKYFNNMQVWGQALEESKIQKTVNSLTNQSGLSKLEQNGIGITEVQKQRFKLTKQTSELDSSEQAQIIKQNLSTDHLQSRKKINFKPIQNHYKAKASRAILRIEPDSQEADSLLKVYRDLKDKKERFIKKKRELVQHDKLGQIDQDQEISQQKDRLFYTLLALLSIVTALPLIRQLACQSKQKQSIIESSPHSQESNQCKSPIGYILLK